jgi:hypothetical protein
MSISSAEECLNRRAEVERERAEAALTFDARIAEWKVLHLAHPSARSAAGCLAF